ncbi:MAG: hypothetical protein CVV11_19840 [Gammaproteobacteria bacterium HGW-Gammaproteobacteria-15]|nr:MAG: hypothetical protein CVV11_19840 [Gammaproteobacteria bacterium HGW-Gammaproteobacteria-15]
MSNTPESAYEFIRKLGPQALDALALTLNETGKNLRQQAIDQIGQQLNLTKDYISRHVTVRERATRARLQVTISAESRPVLLERYDSQQQYRPGKTVDQVNDGVTVQVKAGGSRKRIKQGFFIRLKNGVNGLAMRTGEGQKAYKVLHGPSVAQAYSSVRDDIEPTSDELFQLFIERFEL